MTVPLNVIIMAGGLGKRMESTIPKVLHKILDKPMLVRVIEQSIKLNPEKIFIVVGKYRGIIEQTLNEYLLVHDLPIIFINQPEALGTGHAVQCCSDDLKMDMSKNKTTIVLSGDVPLLKYETMFNIIRHLNMVKIATTKLDNPTGYGRIIESSDRVFQKIVEEKDCSQDEKLINKVNCGIYAFQTEILCKYLPFLSNDNSQKEYYLTDIIEMIRKGENTIVDTYDIPKDSQHEVIGVNTKDQLIELESMMI